MDKLEQPLRIRKPKQPLGKFNNLFRKPKQPLGKFNNLFRKSKQPFPKSRSRKICKDIPLRQYLFLRREFEFRRKSSKYSKYRIRIRKQFFRRKRFFIRSRNQIHYKNIKVISRFIGWQGKIIPRRVTKLTLRQQRLMTTAIKKARILCLLPFLENEIHFRRRWRQILKRRRQNEDKKRSRKTRPKTKPRRIHPKTEPRTTPPKTEPRTTPPKTEPRRIHPKTEPRTTPPKTETGTTRSKTEPRTTRPKTINP